MCGVSNVPENFGMGSAGESGNACVVAANVTVGGALGGAASVEGMIGAQAHSSRVQKRSVRGMRVMPV